MNVWIVNHYAIPPSMGGLVRHYYFSKYLQKKGHSVKIFTSSKIHNTDINMIRDKSLYREEMEDGVEYTFVRSRDYKGNGMDRVVNMMDLPFKTWKAMKRFYKKEKPDVIYTSSPDLFVALFALLFGRKHKIPVVVEVRDLWPESIVEYNGMSRKNPIIQILYQLEKWIYVHSNQLIFTMEGGKDYICDKGWTKEININKVNHVNNGVDLEEFARDIENYQIQDVDLEDTSKFKVVYVGSVRRANNIETLVRVGEELKKRQNEKIKIIIYGDGTDKEFLEKECERKHLDNVVFKGKVDKKYIPYILSKSNLNILNYKQATTWKYGGSQNKQFEYLASGRPICSNVKMGYSIIRNNHCGVEDNIVDVKKYTDIIEKYSDMDIEEYKKECANARKAAEKYEYQHLSDKIENILFKSISKQRVEGKV